MTASTERETPRVVPGVFKSREEAEAAVRALRELGLTDDMIGIAVPDPGRYMVHEDREREEAEAITKGIAAGAPLGTLAGLAISALLLPTGAIGLGGLLVGGVGGALWGTFFGAFNGFTAKVRLDDYEDRWCEIPLQGGDILVVARAGDLAPKVREVMERHGARCFLDEARREDEPR